MTDRRRLRNYREIIGVNCGTKGVSFSDLLFWAAAEVERGAGRAVRDGHRHWYHVPLHNQRAPWLKALLLLKGNQRINVISVPWDLWA